MSQPGAPPSDEELLARSLEVSDAFGEFYDRHVRDVLKFFMRLTLDPQAAADLTAETFAVAFEHRARFRDDYGAPAAAWLYGIARNQYRRMARRGAIDERARRRLGIEPMSLDGESTERIEELVDLQQQKATIHRALSRLPEGTARAVTLRFLENRPYPEVALMLGCSPTAARVRVSRGLRRLSNMIGEMP